MIISFKKDWDILEQLLNLPLSTKPQNDDTLLFNEVFIHWTETCNAEAYFVSKDYETGAIIREPVSTVSVSTYRHCSLLYDTLVIDDDNSSLLFKLTWL